MKIQTRRIWPVFLLPVLLLTACAPSAPKTANAADPVSIAAESTRAAAESTNAAAESGNTAGFNESDLLNRAQGYIAEFQAGNFESFLADADEDLASRCPEEKLREQWASVTGTARAFKSLETPEGFADADHYRVDITSLHTKYQVLTAFIFEKDGAVSDVSFSLKPLHIEPESGDTWYETAITVGYDKEKPLNGMLTLPKDTEHPPVVILVQGSGKNNMDSLIGAAGNRVFADLAHGLAEQGIASIRYDKRSYAYPEDVTDIQTEYLCDVKDAVRFAKEESRVDGNRLYLAGHSQGGMLSPKFVSDNPEFKGLISLGGTLRRMEDLILEQNEEMNAGNNKMTPEERETANAAVADLVAKIKALDAGSEASPDVLLYGYPETYWKSLNQIDSLALAKELAAAEYPMLILQGINDFQVLYEKDYALWQETVSENPNAVCIAYEGLSHVFMPGPKEFVQSVYDPPSHVDPAVIQDMADWIDSQ